MHYAVSTTWGPTDPTRASLPFAFAAAALQLGDTVMIMLFHDAVMVAVEGVHEKTIPVGPPPRFAEVLANANAEVIVCKPCAEARGIHERVLASGCRFGGMNDFHAHASREDCKVVAF
jgi:sulfur relay (sulfurtransferase) complex TusBCD TusD component (DsrE family)